MVRQPASEKSRSSRGLEVMETPRVGKQTQYTRIPQEKTSDKGDTEGEVLRTLK